MIFMFGYSSAQIICNTKYTTSFCLYLSLCKQIHFLLIERFIIKSKGKTF